MQNRINKFEVADDPLDQNLQLQRSLFRILPFWPLIILLILLGYIGSKIYLRYATKVYAIKARVIVNDDSQQKTANLIDIMQLDTRNMSTETEKEMEILQSRNLLSQLAKTLQLNVQYGSKGYIKSGQNFSNVPFKLTLDNPDSVKSSFSGMVIVDNNHIKFNGISYPCDTFVNSRYGKIKWHINNHVLNNNDDWFVKVYTIDTTVNQLQSALIIEPISKQSSILDLTYNDALPERGLNILTNLLSLYGSTTVDYKSRMSQNTLNFLDERLALVSDDLNLAEKKLENYKTKNDIVNLSDQGKMALDQLQNSDAKISELQVQQDVLTKIEQYVKNRNNSGDEIPATLGISDPVLIDLLNQLYRSEFELQKTKQTTGNKNPKIGVLEESIDKLKPSILASINNLKTSINVSLQQLQSNNAKFNSSLYGMPLKERQLLDISRQQSIKNNIYTFLLQKREEAAIQTAGVVANYRVIDNPQISGIVRPKKHIVYLIGILLGLILSSIFIYLKEFSSTKLKFRYQIEDRTNIPIIGEIDYQINKSNSSIVIEEGKRTIVAEEFRELRTNLNYITFKSKENSKVILITSSIPNEGKSFVAINTSISLCLTNKKVVLLEFDLRKPKISKELGIKRDPGLTAYLIGQASAGEIVHRHPNINNFNIIPSGPIPPNPSELISSEKLNELLKYLKQHFDYIIIDSPPTAAVTDAKILAQVADATLYIIRHEYTDSSFLDLIQAMQQKGIFPNLNIVFNGIKVKKVLGYKGYYSGYKYGYSQGYYTEEKKIKGNSVA